MTKSPDARRLDIDWVRTIAGALAAVAAAVVLSTLGAAGTLIGAALGSIVATVAGAVFAQGLDSSRRRLVEAQALARRQVGIAQAEVRRASRAADPAAHDSHLEHAEERLAEANEELDELASAEATAPLGWRDRLARVPWKRTLLISAAIFVVVLAVITVFELVSGRSVSSITGGSEDGRTTIGQISRDRDPGDRGRDRPTPSPGSTPTEAEPTPTDGTEPTPTPTDEATPTEPAGTDEPTPTEEPTPTGLGETPDPAQDPGA